MRPLSLRPYATCLRRFSVSPRRPLPWFGSGSQVPRETRITAEPVIQTTYRLRTHAPPRPISTLTKTAFRYLPLFIGTAALIYYLDPGPVSDEESESGKSEGPPEVEGLEGLGGGGDTEGEEEEEEGGLFIPYSLYKEAPLEFYKATDPEYQEFVKFNRSDKRQAYVILWLIRCTRKFAELNFEEFIGKVDVNAGRYWTDIIYPDGPPATLYQDGILIASDGIYQSTRIANPDEISKISKYFTSFFMAIPSLYVLGMALRDKRILQNQQAEAEEQESQKSSDSRTTPGLTPTPAQSSLFQIALDHKKREVDIQKLWADGMGQVDNGKVFLAAMHRPMPDQIPRGAIAITGLTEAVGTKGRLTVSFVCVFDPKTHGVVSISQTTGPVRPHSQYPKGGW